MNCKKCGAVIDDTASFCNQCGQATDLINNQYENLEGISNQNNSNNGKNNKALIIIIITAIIVALIGSIIGFVVFSNKNDNSDDSSSKSSSSKDKEDDDDEKEDKDEDKDTDESEDEDEDEDEDKDADENEEEDKDEDKDANKNEEEDKDEDKDADTEDEKDKNPPTNTSANSSYIVTNDGIKVTFKIPSTLAEQSEYSDEEFRCIRKNTEDYSRFVAYISEDYGTLDEYMESVEDYVEYIEEEENYSNIELSEIKEMKVNGKTFKYRTLHFNYSTTSFKELYIACEIAEDSLYSVEVDEYDLITDKELEQLLTITVSE